MLEAFHIEKERERRREGGRQGAEAGPPPAHFKERQACQKLADLMHRHLNRDGLCIVLAPQTYFDAMLQGDIRLKK